MSSAFAGNYFGRETDAARGMDGSRLAPVLEDGNAGWMSEGDSTREFHLPGIASADDVAEGAGWSRPGALNNGVGMVEYVECFNAQLEIYTLGNWEVLIERGVEGDFLWPSDGTGLSITEFAPGRGLE